MSFFDWYFGEGFRVFVGYFAIWLRFLVRFFGLAHHLRTLIAPWHRDVSFRGYRGIHPILWAQRLIENIFARVMGAIVRSFMIGISLVVILIFALVYALMIVIWWTLPLYVILSVWVGVSVSLPLALAMQIVPAILYYGVVRVYLLRRPDYMQMSMSQLHQYPWFERVYARIGIEASEVTPEVLANFDKFAQILDRQDISIAEFNDILAMEIHQQQERELALRWWHPDNLKKERPIGMYWSYGYTVHLDRYSVDLSHGDPTGYAEAELTGYRDLLDMLVLTLARPSENNALIIANAGVGKKTLVHHLARMIRHGELDDNRQLRDKRILLVDLAAVIADAAVDDKVGLALHQVFHEAAYAGNVIIVLDNFDHFMQNGKTSYDISSVLNDYLHLNSFQMIALASKKAYHRVLSQRDAIMKSFTLLQMDEMDEVSTMHVLKHKFAKAEAERVILTYPALREIVRLSGRYRADAPLPERAIDLTTELLLYWRDMPNRANLISPELVREFLTVKTGMPMGKIDDAERERLLNMEDILHRQVIGQDDAIREVAEAVRIMRSGITDSDKPMSSFLFLGPTGVGKTETAKALASAYYGSQDAMVRIDMSEFQGANALALLTGDVATGAPGRLTRAVKEHPYSLILLDELEKANPRVLDVFLQILDEGHVTDAFGDKISFRNTIIIATSNAGAVFLRDQLNAGISITDIKQQLFDHIVHEGIYRLEFLNRFSDVILFRPLTDEELRKVTKLMLTRVAEQIKVTKNITVIIDDAVVPVVVERGYSEMFGARSIARFIDDTITDVLARKLIAGDVIRGGTVTITAEDLM